MGLIVSGLNIINNRFKWVIPQDRKSGIILFPTPKAIAILFDSAKKRMIRMKCHK